MTDSCFSKVTFLKAASLPKNDFVISVSSESLRNGFKNDFSVE